MGHDHSERETFTVSRANLPTAEKAIHKRCPQCRSLDMHTGCWPSVCKCSCHIEAQLQFAGLNPSALWQDARNIRKAPLAKAHFGHRH